MKSVGRAAQGFRINKFLSHCGAANSRKQAEQLIANGRVLLNGKPAQIGQVLEHTDIVQFDQKTLKLPYSQSNLGRVWIYHKTPGQLVAHGTLPKSVKAQEKKDHTIRFTSVFEHIRKRFPAIPKVTAAGRLDANTEGLLVLSNNPALCRLLELPSTGLERTYKVRVFGQVVDSKLALLAKGIKVDGEQYRPIKAKVTKRGSSNSWLEVTLTEGKNREVRKAFESIGLRVSRLIRVRFGPYELGTLSPGSLKEVGLSRVLLKLL
jgi:23S rRNA pseudouridine2605 synthase